MDVRPPARVLRTGSLPTGERAVVSFPGIRGPGTAWYVACASAHAPFRVRDSVRATVGPAVPVAIGMRGVTVTPVMRYLGHRGGRDASSGRLDLAPRDPGRGWAR